MSMMFGWPILLTERASSTNRRTSSGFWAMCGASTLIATRLPITGWTAEYTDPIPPSPILRRTRYSPTSIPSGKSPGPAAPPFRRSIVGSWVPSFFKTGTLGGLPPPASPHHDRREDQQRAQAARRLAAAHRAAAAAAPAAAAPRAAVLARGAGRRASARARARAARRTAAAPAARVAGAARGATAAGSAACPARAAGARAGVGEDGAVRGVVLLAHARRLAP